MGLFAIAHHVLDTIGWNGGNSSFQSFSLQCPVVTMPTEFMRGRHTLAMLKTMAVEELIASNVDAYVAISSRLLQDQAFYARIKRRISEKQNLLFDDQAIATAFEAFVCEACRG
jgi:predicted O-linked N-acetylglucosamine transferase (SPINDLY family)